MEAMPKHENRPTTCQLGYCRGDLQGRKRSLYCCDEHAAAARVEQTLEARARRVVTAQLEEVAQGSAMPGVAFGWFSTTDGVMLDGTVVTELRALMDAHRQDMTALAGLLQRDPTLPEGAKQRFRQLLDERDRPLLAALQRVLPQPRPTAT